MSPLTSTAEGYHTHKTITLTTEKPRQQLQPQPPPRSGYVTPSGGQPQAFYAMSGYATPSRGVATELRSGYATPTYPAMMTYNGAMMQATRAYSGAATPTYITSGAATPSGVATPAKKRDQSQHARYEDVYAQYQPTMHQVLNVLILPVSTVYRKL